jgi:hypothetical protein
MTFLAGLGLVLAGFVVGVGATLFLLSYTFFGGSR